MSLVTVMAIPEWLCNRLTWRNLKQVPCLLRINAQTSHLHMSMIPSQLGIQDLSALVVSLIPSCPTCLEDNFA